MRRCWTIVVAPLLLLAGCAGSAPSGDDPLQGPGAREWVRRGQQLLEPEQAGEAREAFSEALRQRPDSVPALLGRAQAALWLSEEEPAARQVAHSDLTHLLTLRPNADAYWLRGSIHFARKDFERAAADLRAAIVLAPRQANGYAAYCQVLLRLERHEEALQAVERALDYAADNTDLHVLHGAVLLKLRRFGESAAALTRALENQANHRSYELRGDAFFAQGEHQAAVVDYTEVLRRRPASLCRVTRGLCFLQLDRHQDAERDFSRWLQRNPSDARVLFWRGVARSKRYAFDLAGQDFLQALAMTPPGQPLRGKILAEQRRMARHQDKVW